ncbi:MAG: hypothetical protein VCA74_08870 [Deltaproteobacteria bacterium]
MKIFSFAVPVSLFVALVLLLPATDAGAWNKGEAKCRATIAKGLGKYVSTANKAIGGCHKSRDKGKISASIACNSIAAADIKNKVPKALGKFLGSLDGPKSKCKDKKSGVVYSAVLANFPRCPSPAQTTDDGGASDGIDDFAELGACLVGLANALVESTAAELLGSPNAAYLKSKPGKGVNKCHGTIAKGYTKLVATYAKELGKAQAGDDKGGSTDVWSQGGNDPRGKIAKAAAKLLSGIDKACGALSKEDANEAASCADDSAGLKDCVGNIANKTGAGLVAAAFELPGVCPTSAPVLFRAGYGEQITNAQLDTGWLGTAHDVDIIDGFQSGVLLACDADCANCVTTTDPSPGYCRCDNDPTQVCDEPFAADNDDCGGATCECFFGPPLSLSSSGTPVCVVSQITQELDCSCDAGTGVCDGACTVSIASLVHGGISQTQPCPTCEGEVCNGGTRDGLSCSVTANHPTFGDSSLDCPPDPISNFSGAGLKIILGLTHGTSSLGFDVDCGLLDTLDCACAVCSGDTTLPCNSDAECTAVGAGTCSSMGTGIDSLPNGCADGNCSADPSGDNEGICTAGPVDQYCDGQVRATGKGFLPCITDADCDAIDSICNGGDCGSCSLQQARNCFLNPVVGQGNPSPHGADMASTFCVPPTASASINAAGGLPGPGRVMINFDYYGVCPDGITPHELPGGSNCP